MQANGQRVPRLLRRPTTCTEHYGDHDATARRTCRCDQPVGARHCQLRLGHQRRGRQRQQRCANRTTIRGRSLVQRPTHNPSASPPSWQQFSAQAKDRLQITLEPEGTRLRPPWYCLPGATRPSRPPVSPSSPAASSSCSPFPAPDQARLQQSWPSLFTQPVASASSRCRSVGRRAAAPASLAPARAPGGAGRLSLDSGQPVNTAAVLARFRRTDMLLHHLRDLPPTRGEALHGGLGPLVSWPGSATGPSDLRQAGRF
jgi:hypothetical protein